MTTEQTAIVTLLVSIGTLLWQNVQFATTKNSEAKNQHDAYHRLIKEIVQPEEKTGHLGSAVNRGVRATQLRPLRRANSSEDLEV
ncbi:MAG: hypothetical protein ABI824_17070 [Acidobacteriota bacterium]